MVWGIWLPSAMLLAIAACFAWRDPRTMRTAIFLLAGLSLAGLTLFGVLLGQASSVEDPDDFTAAWIMLGVLGIALASVLVLAVVLVINGFVLVRREGRSPAHLLSLATGAGILAYSGAAVVAVVAHLEIVAVAIILLGFPLMYLSFVFTAFVAYSAIYLFVTRHWGRPVDAVIVLGAGLRNGRVTPLLASRLNRGVEVFLRSRQSGRQTVLMPSGGQGADESVSEAQAMTVYLEEQGIAPALIVQENRSRTTWENLRYSKDLLAERGIAGRVAVSTNNFHAFRAAMLMRKVGIKGYAVGSPTASYFWPSAVIREFLAVLRDHRWLNGLALVGLSSPLAVLLVVQLAELLNR